MSSPQRSICSSDPQQDLLNAWRRKDMGGFKAALKKENCDPNHLYMDSYMTLLDMCAMDGNVEFASVLIENGVAVNKRNVGRNKSPIHFAAAESGQLGMIRFLVEEHKGDLNMKDDLGRTPLHYLVEHQQKSSEDENRFKQCLEFLLGRSDLQLNVPNRKGFTAVHTAVRVGRLEALKMLLEKGAELDVDTEVGIDKSTAREEIIAKYPELKEDLPAKINQQQIKMDDSTKLFGMLNEENETSFLIAFRQVMEEAQKKDKAQKNYEAQKKLLTIHDGRNTLLQCACEKRLKDAVKVLLEHKADVNHPPLSSRSPTAIACHYGYDDILRLLLEAKPDLSQDGHRDTVLHTVVKETARSKDFQKCLQLLLEDTEGTKLNVNAQDMKGSTPLHYAVKYGNEGSIFALLEKGAYIGPMNCFKEPPLANMKASVLEKYLDNTISIDSTVSLREENYFWNIDYRFLMPNPLRTKEVPLDQVIVPLPGETEKDKLIQSERREPLDKVEVPMTDESEMDNPEKNLPHSVLETDPLLYMSRSADLKKLLTHPVLRNFIILKWQRIQWYFYWNLFFYSVFCVLLTIYILFNKTDFVEQIDWSPVVDVVRWALFIFLFFIILREAFQLLIQGCRYWSNPENWLEIILIVVSTFAVFFNCSRDFPSSGFPANWCPPISAIAIIISWFEFVLFIGKHPRLSLKIEMFKTVTMNFLKVIAWYTILIVAFAFSFFTLFRGCKDGSKGDCKKGNPFANPLLSIFKSVIMLTGEFEAGDIPFLYFVGISHLIFIAFVFFIAIVLFNFLNGLAVTDMQGISKEAELYSTIAQVKLISHIENLFLGEDSPLKLRLKKVRELLCCCNNESKSDGFIFNKYFSERIAFFPNFIPYGKVKVFPNLNYKMEFTQPNDKAKSEDNARDQECCSGSSLNTYLMDQLSAKRIEEILAKRFEDKSEQDELMERIEQILAKRSEDNSQQDVQNEVKRLLREVREARDQASSSRKLKQMKKAQVATLQ